MKKTVHDTLHEVANRDRAVIWLKYSPEYQRSGMDFASPRKEGKSHKMVSKTRL
jgi:hypothetical protein